VWVIEGIPTSYREPYAYSKRVLYIDQDFFGLVVTKMYNQRGELWKAAVACLVYTTKPYEGYPTNPVEGGKYNYKDAWPFVPNGVIVDLQAGTSHHPGGSSKLRKALGVAARMVLQRGRA